MNKKTILIVTTLLLAFSVCFCGCTEKAATEPASSGSETETSTTQKQEEPKETVELKFATVANTGSQLVNNALYMIDRVDEESDGRIAITMFADGTLGSESSNQSALQTGSLDMAGLSSSLPSLIPELNIFDFPYIITDRDQFRAVLKSGVLDEAKAKAEQQGIVIFGIVENGFRQITNNERPINTPEDLSGLKIRTPNNSMRLEIFKKLNANPTPLAFSELFQALSQGVVDGQENPLIQIQGGRLYEVQKYLSITNHIYTPYYNCASASKWAKLSDEDQALILACNEDETEYSLQKGEELDNELISKMEEEGLTVNQADIAAFRDATMPLWDQFADTVGTDFLEKVKEIVGA